MDLVEVDVVEIEPLERRVDRGEDVLAREPAPVLARHRPPVDLRRDDVLLAHAEEPLQQAAGDDLALAPVVDVGGVEEDDSALDRAAHDRLGRGLVERPFPALVLAEAHHPQAEARDAQTGLAKIQVLHALDLDVTRSRWVEDLAPPHKED